MTMGAGPWFYDNKVRKVMEMKTIGNAVMVGVLALCALSMSAQTPQADPLEVVASISSQDFSGVVVTMDNRIFIGAPHEVDDYASQRWPNTRTGKWCRTQVAKSVCSETRICPRSW